MSYSLQPRHSSKGLGFPLHPHRGFGLSGTDLTIIYEYENPNLNNYYKSSVNVKNLADIALKEEIVQIGRRSSEDLT
jgi:hypothetical protein